MLTKKSVGVVMAMSLMMLIFAPMSVEAITYCSDNIAYTEVIINESFIFSEGENCSRIGALCTDEIGCHSPPIYRPIITGLFLGIGTLIMFGLIRKRR